MDDLSPELRAYRDRFKMLRCDAEVLITDVSTEVFNTSPAPGAWSMAQCFDHLNTAGKQLVPRLEAAIDEAKKKGPFGEGPFRYGIFSRWFIRAMRPESGWKMPAPSSYAPADTALDPDDVLATFQALQDRLIACTERAQGLDLKQIRVSSPFFRLLRFSLGAWLAATAAHEERHLQQARRVRRDLNEES